MSCKGGERCTTCMEEVEVRRNAIKTHSIFAGIHGPALPFLLLPWLSPVNISEDRIQPDLGLKKEL
jgi:hypothetical protein